MTDNDGFHDEGSFDDMAGSNPYGAMIECPSCPHTSRTPERAAAHEESTDCRAFRADALAQGWPGR